MNKEKIQKIVFFLIFFFFIIYFLGTILPIFICEQNSELCNNVYFAYSNSCHQKPERSFFLNDIQLSVCSRCFATYLFLVIGLGVYLFRGMKKFKMNWIILILLSMPALLDGGTQFIGLRESNNILRAISGFFLGIGAAYYLSWFSHLLANLILVLKNMLKNNNKKLKKTVKEIKELF